MLHLLAAATPDAALPGAALVGITWAAGAAVLAAGGLLDVLAFKRSAGWRMSGVTFLYFSGWLTSLTALGARGWWDFYVTDANWRLGFQLASLFVQGFVIFAIAGLALGKWIKAGPVAHDKVGLTHSDATKPKLTGSVVGWTFAAALLALACPPDAWASTHVTKVLSSPGDAIGATAVHAAIIAVGQGRPNGSAK
jgi:hypothetical protein